MGIFGKLFEKKECDICGGEIGLLGNRKLEDGNLCKNCAGKLSPWFDDRRHSTVEEIKKQLDYREENKEKVAAFRVTRTFGDNTKILLDEDARKFMVTSARDLKEANPDVLDFSDVTGCVLDIDENRTELTQRNSEGEEISYNPPRYVYEYQFWITIHVRNPYFDDIRFKLNNRDVEIEIQGSFRPGSLGGGPGKFGQLFGSTSNNINPEYNIEYRNYKEMGEEIKAALLQVRQQVRDEVVAAAAPKTAVTCPYCGATTMPNASGCCEFCGGALG